MQIIRIGLSFRFGNPRATTRLTAVTIVFQSRPKQRAVIGFCEMRMWKA